MLALGIAMTVVSGTVVCAAVTGIIVNGYRGIYGKLREKVRASRKTAIMNQFEPDAAEAAEALAV